MNRSQIYVWQRFTTNELSTTNDLRLIYYHPKSFSWLPFYITKKQIKFNHFHTKIISNDRKRLNLHWTIQYLVSRLKIQITSKDPNPNYFGMNYNAFKTRNKSLEGKFVFLFSSKRGLHIKTKIYPTIEFHPHIKEFMHS